MNEEQVSPERQRIHAMLQECLADAQEKGLHAGIKLGISDCIMEDLLLLEQEWKGKP